LKRTEETSKATTASVIVNARSRRGVSHIQSWARSQERVPEAAAIAVAAQAEHIRPDYP